MIDYLEKPKYLAPVNDDKAEHDFSVLTNRENIKNIAESICNALHHPCTIIDINRYNNIKDSSEIRIESNVSRFSMRSSCRLLRHCAGEEICHQCDGFHAAILKDNIECDKIDKLIDDINLSIKTKIKNAPKLFYDNYDRNFPIAKPLYKRPVIEYYCPILGYRELAFPIYFNKKVIAVLTLGQAMINNDEDKKRVKEISEAFFLKNEPKILFSKYLKPHGFPDSEAEKIKKAIVKADGKSHELVGYLLLPNHEVHNESPSPENMTFFSENDYQNFIDNACEKLNDIEKKLVKDARKKKVRYFDKTMCNITKNFFAEIDEEEKNGTLDKREQRRSELENAWRLLTKSVDSLKSQLQLDDVLIFGDGTSLEIKASSLKSLYPLPKKNNVRHKWCYDFSEIKGYSSNAYDIIDSLEHKNILKGLSSEIMRENVILLVCHDIALLLQVQKLDIHQELYKEMIGVIGKKISRMRSYVALCAANYMKEHHVFSLRMNRHESAHISTIINDNLQRYFVPHGVNFIDLEVHRRERVVSDMVSATQLISNMATNIGAITGIFSDAFVKSKIEKVFVRGIFHKWRVMLKDSLKDRNLNFVGPKYETKPYFFSDNYNEDTEVIFTNSHLFELLVYNLMDNAVKYAYRGSNIYLSWTYPFESSHYKLEVSSFGPEVTEDERIYALYIRENNNEFTSTMGEGIGLYVVKQIAKLLKLEISHTCKRVEEKYHLPLMDYYINENFSSPDDKKMQKQLSEYMKEKRDFNLADIINKNPQTQIEPARNLTPQYLRERINEGTWLTTFTVSVPRSMKRY
ncbi:MAG: ATP-binding protein [Lachnospiraceae bacterium]|nr:ATP-binding protein [Lachnospiraceae bacterium]